MDEIFKVNDQNILISINYKLVKYIKSVRAHQDFKSSIDFKVGDVVEFNRSRSSETGGIITGTIIKKNIKRAKIKEIASPLVWNVHFCSLRKVK